MLQIQVRGELQGHKRANMQYLLTSEILKSKCLLKRVWKETVPHGCQILDGRLKTGLPVSRKPSGEKKHSKTSWETWKTCGKLRSQDGEKFRNFDMG